MAATPRAVLTAVLALCTLLALGGAGRAVHEWVAHPEAAHAHHGHGHHQDDSSPAPERDAPADSGDCDLCLALAHAAEALPGGGEAVHALRPPARSRPVVAARRPGFDLLAPGPGRGPPKTA